MQRSSLFCAIVPSQINAQPNFGNRHPVSGEESPILQIEVRPISEWTRQEIEEKLKQLREQLQFGENFLTDEEKQAIQTDINRLEGQLLLNSGVNERQDGEEQTEDDLNLEEEAELTPEQRAEAERWMNERLGSIGERLDREREAEEQRLQEQVEEMLRERAENDPSLLEPIRVPLDNNGVIWRWLHHEVYVRTEDPGRMDLDDLTRESINLQIQLGEAEGAEDSPEIPEPLKEKLRERLKELNQEIERRRQADEASAEESNPRPIRFFPFGFFPNNTRPETLDRSLNQGRTGLQRRRIRKIKIEGPGRRPAFNNREHLDPYPGPYDNPAINRRQTTDNAHTPAIYGKAISEQGHQALSTRLYPNPAIAGESVVIDHVHGLVEVFTLHGLLIWSAEAAGQAVVPAGTLASGTSYFVRNGSHATTLIVR